MSTTLKVGESQQLPAAPKFVSSNPDVLKVSTSGLVTALAQGIANVRAVTSFEVVAADGTPAPDPAPVPAPSTGSNEPSGMTVLTDRRFAKLDEMGWEDEGTGRVTSDATTPSFLRTTLPAGFVAGSGNADGNFSFTPRRTLYVDFTARYSDNWVGGEAGLDKLFYVYEKGETPSLVFVASGSGKSKKAALMEGQEILAGGAGHGDAANPDWGPNQGVPAEIVRGRWFRGEAVLVGNTQGKADGTIEFFLDGVRVISYSGIKFVTGDCLWALMHYTNIWTGSSGKVPASQTLDFSHFYLSAK